MEEIQPLRTVVLTSLLSGKSTSRQDILYDILQSMYRYYMIRKWQEMWDGEVKGHLYNIQKHVGNGRKTLEVGRRTQ